MGESDRYIEYKFKKQRFTLGSPGNALMWLFALNVIMFLILQVIRVAINVNDHSDTFFYTEVTSWFQIPAGAKAFSTRPWTLISYMFTDVFLMRIFSNMLWLWAFGSVFQNLTGNNKLIPVYLYGGFAGALFFLAAVSFSTPSLAINDLAGLLGANASVLAIAVAATAIAPNYRLFSHISGGIPLWVLTVIYIAIDLVAIARGPLAWPVAHVGGAAAGLLFVLLLKNNIDGSRWMNSLYNWFINLFNPNKTEPKNPDREAIFYNKGNRDPYKKTANVTQQRVDEILDKISQKGYNSLSKDEKEILKRASED